ncbi:MAG TPA: rRNA maturation RNase YbeY [Alphaproteobacteria bacterium]|jgi:probable rRNA maturation factor|nr:rRNA maturation RNase YbeY [Alphaproteobacteria bacterium]
MSDRTRLRLALEIEDTRWTGALPDVAELLEKAIALALADVDDRSRTIEVGVRLVDDGTIQGLNRDWRGRDKPTNVLSFPMGDPAPVGNPAMGDPDFPWLIGDIVMSFDTMKAEAERDGKPLEHHLVHLAVHAALHLIGHDHEDEAEAEAMEAAEVELLANLGIPDPYAHTGDTP